MQKRATRGGVARYVFRTTDFIAYEGTSEVSCIDAREHRCIFECITQRRLLAEREDESCVRGTAVEETRRKIDRQPRRPPVHSSTRTYTRARAYTLLRPPLRCFIAGANTRIDTRAYAFFRALSRGRFPSRRYYER